ncbi:MAG: hypothetical protein JWM24_975 [Solirubrobacterales bacterium]|nr:hypothetical protein [Solirubrobacterales bacterium]
MLLRSLQAAGELLLRPAPLVSGSFRQREVLAVTGHRPWPLPSEPWFMGQTWCNLLFAHWRVPAPALEAVVPRQLSLDTYDGSAWLGITPFGVRGLRLRGTTPVPRLSSFSEINVRTYVTVGGRPGIYFLSLDADSWPAVHAARRSYRLPYFRAEIAADGGQSFDFDATRVSGAGPPAFFKVAYGPRGELLPERAGSLQRWLTERYCLYTFDERRRIQRGEIHHPPWPLRRAWAEIETNTMASPYGIVLEGEPLLHFAARQDVALWPIRPV